ncbi:hypothetical protein NX773_02015 [Massilia solisilvae]|uniref:Uncharacterized protein n=1 Tax=Massilia solisilvae TaxID=1811225 RepID=A0ABT2BEI8_9BURK|nr:hypothetical protein [Massilia solisilvae]MCS0606938.1 hypothetical protein [Massilia solisilvae]
MNRTIHVALAAALSAATGGALAQAQAQMQLPQARPAHGQSADRQSRDESACVTTARKRTGLDPYVLAENSTPLQPGKGITSVPIEAPSMAMGSSGGGATGAGSETGTQPAQAGAMGASGGGQTGAGGEQMGAQGGMAGGGQMGASGSTGETGAGGMASTGGAAGAGMSGAGATGAAGSSGAAGATGAGGTQMAQHNTADVFNRAFARCMTSRGYIVESVSQGGTP